MVALHRIEAAHDLARVAEVDQVNIHRMHLLNVLPTKHFDLFVVGSRSGASNRSRSGSRTSARSRSGSRSSKCERLNIKKQL